MNERDQHRYFCLQPQRTEPKEIMDIALPSDVAKQVKACKVRTMSEHALYVNAVSHLVSCSKF